ncbi:MAG: tail fiber domain-containing protein [Flavobacteriales bacterium]
MKQALRLAHLILGAFVIVLGYGQTWQPLGGTHLETSTATDGVIIGDVAAAPSPNVALTIDSRAVNTPTAELFHTITPTGQNGFWRAFRNTTELGRIYTTNPGQGFHIRAVQANDPDPGILWLENNDADGYMLRANGAQTSVNGYPLTLDGFMSIGKRGSTLFNGMNAMPSRARLQMVDYDGYEEAPWRPYFRNGVLFTGNNDMAYIGHVYHDASGGTTPWTYTSDRSDLVISTGENSLTETYRSRIRFTYTTTPTSGGTGAQSYNGLEFMQMFAGGNVQPFVGIGDFTAATQDPDERLDILNRTIRIRKLVNDYRGDTLSRFVVSDGTGRLHWRYINTVPGAPDCDWDLMPGPPGVLATAWDPSPTTGCPAQDWNVGIGKNSGLTGKLTVLDDLAASSVTLGIDVLSGANGTVDTGVKSKADGLETNGSLSTTATGVQAIAENAHTTHGVNVTATLANNKTANVEIVGVMSNANISGTVPLSAGTVSYGTAASSATITQLYGVLGVGQNISGGSVSKLVGVMGQVGRATGNTQPCYAIYGDAPQGASTSSYAGFFDGDVEVTGDLNVSGFFTNSDAALKDNVQPITDASQVLMQLQPRSYQYNTAVPQLLLPGGTHLGFIAQDIAQVLPDIVKQSHIPADMDSVGNVLAPAADVLSVNYTEVIPLLVAGFKEQQALITSLQDQIANCCSQGMAPQESTGGIGYIDNSTSAGNTRNLQADELVVTPNPFTENPTISYRIGTSGRAQLRVTSASSRDMSVLYDAGTAAGQYSMVWNTVGMAPGLYLLTLTVDGKRVTEQAVKVE